MSTKTKLIPLVGILKFIISIPNDPFLLESYYKLLIL